MAIPRQVYCVIDQSRKASLLDNMLVACRAFASEAIVNEYFNLIPHCIAFGQAAGTAAAQSISSGLDLRKIDIRTLQANLIKQGVILPG